MCNEDEEKVLGSSYFRKSLDWTIWIHSEVINIHAFLFRITDVDIDEVNTSIRITVIGATCSSPTYLEWRG